MVTVKMLFLSVVFINGYYLCTGNYEAYPHETKTRTKFNIFCQR